MSIPQLINTYITSKRGAALCNRCIADGLGLANIGAQPGQVTAALATTSDFTRGFGDCSGCNKKREVIRANRN